MKSTSEPLVSIIMNCYNGEKFLREAIDSVYAQIYQNWEIIFWDNNSIDQSINLIKKIKDKRLKIFKSSKTIRLYDARNHAINRSTGKFLAFLDIDDTWHPKKIEKQMRRLFSNIERDKLFSNYEREKLLSTKNEKYTLEQQTRKSYS